MTWHQKIKALINLRSIGGLFLALSALMLPVCLIYMGDNLNWLNKPDVKIIISISITFLALSFLCFLMNFLVFLGTKEGKESIRAALNMPPTFFKYLLSADPIPKISNSSKTYFKISAALGITLIVAIVWRSYLVSIANCGHSFYTGPIKIFVYLIGFTLQILLSLAFLFLVRNKPAVSVRKKAIILSLALSVIWLTGNLIIAGLQWVTRFTSNGIVLCFY